MCEKTLESGLEIEGSRSSVSLERSDAWFECWEIGRFRYA